MLEGKLFERVLRSLAICLSVSNSCGKLVSVLELPSILDDNLKVISV